MLSNYIIIGSPGIVSHMDGSDELDIESMNNDLYWHVNGNPEWERFKRRGDGGG